MGSGLVGVLAAHLYRESTAGRAAHCSCGMWILGGLEITHRAHVAAMIVAHIEAVAGDAAVREAVRFEVCRALPVERGIVVRPASTYHTAAVEEALADAAVAAFIEAVTG